MHTIALSDADSSSALRYVKEKLANDNTKSSVELSAEEIKAVGQLGGRASDLESVSSPSSTLKLYETDISFSADPQG